ncbi:MAG TPA: hypothetical protein VFH85_07640 [Gammaproteobacteria bacterium]|nr:hypothetical protein [Gammaproteobacteria bacterium]
MNAKLLNLLGAVTCTSLASFLVWMVLFPHLFRRYALQVMDMVAGVFS